MKKLINLLKQEQLTCIVSQHQTLYREKANGIQPILRFLEEGHLSGALLVDKVIGKAAAMMMVYGGVQRVHALVISAPALLFLQQHGVAVTYDTVVPYIINRSKDGMCPMESCVLHVDDMQEAHQLLLAKLASMKAVQK